MTEAWLELFHVSGSGLGLWFYLLVSGDSLSLVLHTP